MVVFNGALNKLINFIENNQQVGIVAPQVLNPDKTIVDSCCRWPKWNTFIYRRTFLGQIEKGQKELDRFLYKDLDLSQAQKVNWIFGCCLLLRKKALDEAGLFDENFFLFLEDTDLCRRMWKKNWQVWYVPQAQVVHYPHRLSSGSNNLKDLF